MIVIENEPHQLLAFGWQLALDGRIFFLILDFGFFLFVVILLKIGVLLGLAVFESVLPSQARLVLELLAELFFCLFQSGSINGLGLAWLADSSPSCVYIVVRVGLVLNQLYEVKLIA